VNLAPEPLALFLQLDSVSLSRSESSFIFQLCGSVDAILIPHSLLLMLYKKGKQRFTVLTVSTVSAHHKSVRILACKPDKIKCKGYDKIRN